MKHHSPSLLPKLRSDVLMDAMRHYPCTLRLCTFLGESCAPSNTVVGCHLDSQGRGMSTKSSDLYVVAGCMKCHDILDRRDSRWKILHERYPAATERQIRMALQETLALLLRDGIIIVKGGEII